MRIEIATPEHREHIARIMLQANHRDDAWSLPRIDKYIKKADHDIIVAVKDLTVGYAGIKSLYDDENVKNHIGDAIANFSQLTWIGILPEHQRQGIARMIIASAEEWSKNKGKDGVWLGCLKKLVGFYEHLGFSIAGQYEEYGKIRYIMAKRHSSNIPLTI